MLKRLYMNDLPDKGIINEISVWLRVEVKSPVEKTQIQSSFIP